MHPSSLTALLVTLPAALTGARALALGDTPNVLLVMTDDQGWGDVGYRGHPELRTPGLDALAGSGVRLDRFYASSPVCSPTRASVLTGRHPARMRIDGANNGHLPASEHTLAELLEARGYATGFFGKWHLGTLTRTVLDSNRGGRDKHDAHFSPPAPHGFQVVFATEAKVPTWDPMISPETGEAYGTAYWDREGVQVTHGLEGDDSRVIVDRVVPFMQDSVAADRPFLAVVWLHSPHEPVVSPDRPTRHPDVEDPTKRAYYDCLADVDEQVSRMVETLEELGVRENTLVWFNSDNGPEHRTGPGSTGGLRGRKRSLYEGGVRVPGIVSWPARLPGGRTVDAPLSTLDILPTLAGILDLHLDPARPLDGADVLPLLSGSTDRAAPRDLFFRSGSRRAVHRGDHKLVLERGETAELYDLRADPGETRDLSAELPGLLQSLELALESWEGSVGRSREGVEDSPVVALDRTASRPHVLFILADDLGAEWLSTTGGALATPHLDALAASGTTFTRAWSQPKCTPSRITLLTGQYPFRHGWVDHWDVPRWGEAWFDPAEYHTLPEVMSAAGYRNVAAGKWQVNDFRETALHSHHFQDWLMWTGYEDGRPQSAERYADPFLHDPTGTRTHEGEWGPDLFVDFLCERISEEAGAGPLFLYYPMVLPHGPYVPTPRQPGVEGRAACYAAMVQHVDHLVGRLVTCLEENGLREETLVIFTTDNGTGGELTGTTSDGAKVRGGKGRLSQAGIAAPFLVSWPGSVPAGRTSDALLDFTDLLPTLAEVAGAELAVDLELDGTSQLGEWLGREDAPRRQWTLAMGGGKARLDGETGRVLPAKSWADRAVSDGRYKLWYQDGQPSRLHDLLHDPREEIDLLESQDAGVRAALIRLQEVVAGLPVRDAAPRYRLPSGAR